MSDTNIYLCDLPLDMTKEDLDVLCAQFGPVESATILLSGSISRGIAFARFATTEAAQAAIDALHNTSLPNSTKPLTVRFARKREKNGKNNNNTINSGNANVPDEQKGNANNGGNGQYGAGNMRGVNPSDLPGQQAPYGYHFNNPNNPNYMNGQPMAYQYIPLYLSQNQLGSDLGMGDVQNLNTDHAQNNSALNSPHNQNLNHHLAMSQGNGQLMGYDQVQDSNRQYSDANNTLGSMNQLPNNTSGPNGSTPQGANGLYQGYPNNRGQLQNLANLQHLVSNQQVYFMPGIQPMFNGQQSPQSATSPQGQTGHGNLDMFTGHYVTANGQLVSYPKGSGQHNPNNPNHNQRKGKNQRRKNSNSRARNNNHNQKGGHGGSAQQL